MKAGTVSTIRIGCSGWNYRHWRDRFYPKGVPVRRWFAFYAGQFDTVEINNSFYRLPPCETFEKWRDQAPPGFCYAVKANRFITQAKKLKDCEEPVERQMRAFRCLGDRLGPVLYQLPPSLKFDLQRLADFLKLLPGDVANVFEFRDSSWHVPETYALLERHGASLCLHDMSGCGVDPIAVGPTAYVRFHGASGKYRGRYAEPALLRWAEWMADQARSGRPVWAFFNNDIDAAAIADAQTLRSMTGQLLR